MILTRKKLFVAAGLAVMIGFHPLSPRVFGVYHEQVLVTAAVLAGLVLIIFARRPVSRCAGLGAVVLAFILSVRVPEGAVAVPILDAESAVILGASAIHSATRATIAPWTTPWWGIHLSENGVVPCLVIALVAGVVLIALRRRDDRALHLASASLTLGLLLVVLHFARGGGHLGAAWCFGLGLLATSGLFLVRLWQLFGWSTTIRRFARVVLCLSVAAYCSFSVKPVITQWKAWIDEGDAWREVLDEQGAICPRSALAARLLDLGDVDTFLRERRRTNSGKTQSDADRLHFAAWLLSKQRPADAVAELTGHESLLSNLSTSQRQEIVDALIRLKDADRLPAFISAAHDLPEATRMAAIDVFLAAGKHADAQELSDNALAVSQPSVRAFSTAFEVLTATRADPARFKDLAERMIQLHPNEALGYVVLGKQAKTVRRDDEMIRWHELALARDPRRADLHFDLAIVYHGREDGREKAIHHYRQVVALSPDDSRRARIEAWILSLEAEATAKGAR